VLGNVPAAARVPLHPPSAERVYFLLIHCTFNVLGNVPAAARVPLHPPGAELPVRHLRVQDPAEL
jgi:hypothetical protein